MTSFKVRTHELVRTKTNISFILSLFFSGLTGLAAQIVIPLPFTPIPITGQTFIVLLSGFVLGHRYGPLSQVFYVLFGVIGIPWFANGSSGIDVLLGATGGYLVGFIFSSFIIGYISDLSEEMRNPKVILMVSALGTFIIYICGIAGLMLVGLNLWQSLLLGFFPFLPGDIFKLIFVFITASLLLPSVKTNADLGITSSRMQIISYIFLVSSILLIITFILYLLNAGNQPPSNLVSFSLFSVLVLLPSGYLISKNNI